MTKHLNTMKTIKTNCTRKRSRSRLIKTQTRSLSRPSSLASTTSKISKIRLQKNLSWKLVVLPNQVPASLLNHLRVHSDQQKNNKGSQSITPQVKWRSKLRSHRASRRWRNHKLQISLMWLALTLVGKRQDVVGKHELLQSLLELRRLKHMFLSTK